MRRFTFAVLLALALGVATVAPVLGKSDGNMKDPDGKINIWCAMDKGTQVDLNGSLVVPDGTHGSISLWLFGTKDGTSWQFAWQHQVVNVMKGQTTYGFHFDGKLDSNHFMAYRVVGDGTKSRVINRDECGFRVPEAPATPLLLLGAFPAAGLIAIKATGVRLPLPHLHRIV